MEEKKSLRFEDIIKYLSSNKKITFNRITEGDAIKILRIHGYHNVIAPFKFYFADRDTSDPSRLLLTDNRHTYSKETDFYDWYQHFKEERDAYPIIYKNIVLIKTAFKNALFNTIFTNNNINDTNQLNYF